MRVYEAMYLQIFREVPPVAMVCCSSSNSEWCASGPGGSNRTRQYLLVIRPFMSPLCGERDEGVVFLSPGSLNSRLESQHRSSECDCRPSCSACNSMAADIHMAAGGGLYTGLICNSVRCSPDTASALVSVKSFLASLHDCHGW